MLISAGVGVIEMFPPRYEEEIRYISVFGRATQSLSGKVDWNSFHPGSAEKMVEMRLKAYPMREKSPRLMVHAWSSA